MGPPRDPGPALSNATTPPRQPATQPSSVEDDAHRKRRPGTLSYPPARISPTEASTTARPPPASPHATSGLGGAGSTTWGSGSAAMGASTGAGGVHGSGVQGSGACASSAGVAVAAGFDRMRGELGGRDLLGGRHRVGSRRGGRGAPRRGSCRGSSRVAAHSAYRPRSPIPRNRRVSSEKTSMPSCSCSAATMRCAVAACTRSGSGWPCRSIIDSQRDSQRRRAPSGRYVA
jgi:hypothetical protein